MTNIVGLTDLNAVGEQAVELSAARAKTFSRHAHRSQRSCGMNTALLISLSRLSATVKARSPGCSLTCEYSYSVLQCLF
jgi:hypothetical protein